MKGVNKRLLQAQSVLPKRGQKQGQFYLIAALVIIVLIIGLVAVYNYTSEPTESRIEGLSEELQIEGGTILDYGASTGIYPWNKFTKNFTDYAGQEIDITYVTGLDSAPNAFYYDDNGDQQQATTWQQGSTITVTHNNANYSFEIKQGQNFYFIMSQSIGEEYYVTTN
jgi:hypothetical protein